MKKTIQVSIEGKVQGVGFRPFVYQLAQKMDLKGWVNNGNEGVKIEVSGVGEDLEVFLEKLQSKKPAIAYITKIVSREIPLKDFQEFKIIHSEDTGKKKLLLTTDLDTCQTCLTEFYNPTSRFFHYPFIACTNCGTRYSIIKKLPYDRENTTMQKFDFCENCETEYHNPNDRRFYTQNHSCAECGIELGLYNSQNQLLSRGFKSLEQSITLLEEGKILAIKGIGGFLFMVDASNQNTIQTLRVRKNRPKKPFALMYPNLASVESDVFVSNVEKEALQSRAKPIVLLQVRKEPKSKICLESIVPEIESKKLGIILPYTALFDYILQKVQKPLIATSGNLTNIPIVFENRQALEELKEIADFILVNNRTIVVPQDDSVMRFSPLFQQSIIIRRSRGYAPNYLINHEESIIENVEKMVKNKVNNSITQAFNHSILALGAELKSSFTLTHEGNVYTSQYLGDLQSFEAQENFRHTLEHFLNLFEARPEVIVSDKHPAYFTTNLGQELAEKWKIPHYKIQHHEAHFWAVLGENNLWNEKVLGVIWDGTGLGNDAQIWGGEFFTYQNQILKRIEHFEYFPHFLADKMPKEPRISALVICKRLEQAQEILEKKFSQTEWKLYQKLLKQTPRLLNSSVGRIFDAIASLLGWGDLQSFEGENAMKLEVTAQKFYEQTPNFQEYYTPSLDTEKLFENILLDITKQKTRKEIAFKFHLTLIKVIEKVAEENNCQKIAFSGGVWQNALLVDLAIQYLSKKFDLYFHQQLSPNDENISFGQMIAFSNKKLIDKNNS